MAVARGASFAPLPLPLGVFHGFVLLSQKFIGLRRVAAPRDAVKTPDICL